MADPYIEKDKDRERRHALALAEALQAVEKIARMMGITGLEEDERNVFMLMLARNLIESVEMSALLEWRKKALVVPPLEKK